MSLEAVAAQAKRALANQHKAAVGTPAKKGDLIVYEVVRSFTALKGGTTTKTEYALGIVLSTSRTNKGEVTRYRDAGGFEHKGRPSRLWLVSSDRIDAEAALASRSEYPRELPSMEAAQKHLRQFLKKPA